MRTWRVSYEPVGSNRDGKNQSGLMVVLTDGEVEHEVGRVAFRREDSKNPGVSFADQLDVETEKGEQAAEALNAALDELDRLEEEHTQRARERVAEILGDADRGLQ